MECVSFTGLKLCQAETPLALDFLEPNLTVTAMGKLEGCLWTLPPFLEVSYISPEAYFTVAFPYLETTEYLG